jgi:hypothetical protein
VLSRPKDQRCQHKQQLIATAGFDTTFALSHFLF